MGLDKGAFDARENRSGVLPVVSPRQQSASVVIASSEATKQSMAPQADEWIASLRSQ